jgi:hypothetical protein
VELTHPRAARERGPAGFVKPVHQGSTLRQTVDRLLDGVQVGHGDGIPPMCQNLLEEHRVHPQQTPRLLVGVDFPDDLVLIVDDAPRAWLRCRHVRVVCVLYI